VSESQEERDREEEVEGHKKAPGAPTEEPADVEGHKKAPGSPTEEPADVEGHMKRSQ
jgi:hypothetical protein